MKRRFSLFLAILMLVSVFSPLGLGFEGNEIRFSTNVVEAAEDDAQSNEATPKEEVNNASEEVTPDVDNGTPSTEDKDVQPEVDLKDQNIILTNDILTIGKDVTERNFTWYANTKEKGKFEFAKLNAEKDFKDATVLDATVIEKTNLSGYSSNQVTLDGLEPDTEYMYRFSNGDAVSEVKTFKTGGTGDFSFFAAGDPQIGSHGYLNGKDGWDKTLKLLPELDSSASFLLSLGDQVDTGKDEEQYDAYINREGFNGLTLAPIIGNHDERGNAHEEHFKVSNVQDEGKSNAGSNYYYVYNNTLFICLNSNNKDYAEHKVTIEKAIAENPNVKWRVVTFHHPPYTVASHALDDYITDMRSTLVPILKENKIDLVLNGHDHVYTRTHVMDGTKPIIEWENGEEGKAPSEYVNPKGIIYVTTNSASGSKFYDIMQDKKFEYSAVKNQEKIPNISNVKVTDNSIEVTTYRTSDKSIVDSFKIVKNETTDEEVKLTNDILTIGKDGTERNFTWYANTKEKGKFEFAKLNAEKDFKDATVLDATVIEKTNLSGYSSNQVTLDGLEPDTEYMYRFSNGDAVSEVKTFKTGGTGDFSFFAAGDPQIGSHGYLNGKDGWDKTLKLLPELDSSASFLLSLGDQVDTGKDEEQYDAYINREGFNGLTLAPIIGNHDERGNAHEEHFKVSNVQDEGKSNAGSNYYYVYNNTLFICLNSNNKDYAEHKVTIEKAIAENPNVKWRVVTFHHPPYTVASHALDDYITDMRSTLVPILKENKIDLVLNGHDHVYTRTHVMDGTKPIIEWENGEEGKAPSEYVNPKGIIYVTTNSASGSKFYDIMQDKKFEYSAVKNQEKIPNISNVKVTDNSIEVTTYRTRDKSVVDSFKIVKEDKKENQDKPVIPTPVEPEKDNKDDKEESSSNVRRHRSHSHTKTYPVYTSKSSNFTKEDALKKGEEIANKNLAKNSGKVTDIDGHWAKDSINYALENNLIDLIGNEFKPNKNATRYNVVKALGRFKKIDVEKYKGKSLKDVDANSEESAYVNWAIENGIIAGYEDNTFGGDREITREEIARILNLFAEKFDIKVKNLEAPKFKDQNKISDWASKDVKEATEKGLLVGRDDGTFGPKDNLTRAEVAQMIVNMIK